jgi:hypothetical protein
MNGQPDLFDAPFVRRSKTSRDAANQIKHELPRLQKIVLDAIKESEHGLTDEDGIFVTNLPASTYRPRRIELQRAGKIKDSEQTRRTLAGRKAVVWVAV